MSSYDMYHYGDDLDSQSHAEPPRTYLTEDGPTPLKCATASARPYDPAGVENDGYGDTEPVKAYCQRCGHWDGVDHEGQSHVFVANDPPVEPVDWKARAEAVLTWLDEIEPEASWHWVNDVRRLLNGEVL